MDGLNKDELIKSLVEAGIPEEEAKLMIIEKSEEEEDGTKPSDETYSEEKEKELEKAAKEAEEAYKCYVSKKGGKIEKSEEQSLGVPAVEESELMKSMNNFMEGFSKSFDEKLDEFSKSLEVISSLEEKVNHLSDEVDKIGNQTPQPKSLHFTKEAVIEKAVDGIKQDDKIHMGVKTHKGQISEILSDLVLESEGELRKSLETDLSNYNGGFGSLGTVAKRILLEKKNIVVH